MSNQYVEKYGDDTVVLVLGNKNFMIAAWMVFMAVAGLSAFNFGERLDLTSQIALWALFTEGLATVIFGLYRSLFYNFLCGLSAVSIATLALPSLIMATDGVLVSLRLLPILAILIGCFAVAGTTIVSSIVIQSWSIK